MVDARSATTITRCDQLDELRLAVGARFPRICRCRKAINILCINGRAGDPGHVRQVPQWRGQQVASGRFGVSAEMLNSSYVAEIKIARAQSPRGRALPGKKVSEKVASARNATPART